MIKLEGKTTTGFEYKIKESAINNFELIDALSELEDNPLLLPIILKLLLGEKQKKALLNHVRKEDNTVPNDLIEKEIMDIFKGSQDTKNS